MNIIKEGDDITDLNTPVQSIINGHPIPIEKTEEITAVIPEQRVIKQDPFYKLINDRREKLLPLLNNDSFLFEKMARGFVFTLHKEDLIQCNSRSIVDAFIKCCEVKLEPTTGLGKIYLSSNQKGNLKVDIGYIGWLELLWRAPLVSNVYSNVVYEEDDFELEYGINTVFRHKPKYLSDKLKMTYGVVKFSNGEIQIRAASMKEILQSKEANPNSKSALSPWNKYFDAMAQVVPLRKLAKVLALSVRNDNEEEIVNNNEIRTSNLEETIL